MPLDTGAFGDEAIEAAGAARRSRLVLDPSRPIGAALAAARASLGLSLEEVSEATRVRVRHLEALEAGAIEQLPSRPFQIGYVRAYAKTLGLDADATAARFRAEHPSPDDELRGPVGVRHSGHAARNGTVIALVAVAIVAVVGWNITRHAIANPPKRSAGAAASQALAVARTNAVAGGAFSVNTPLPAPPEASPPPTYITPVVDANAPANSIASNALAQAADAAPTPFVAQGAIYGPAAKAASPLIIQAKKSISLEVRGPNGVVYFARQLAAGEAYRVPALPNLTAEVSNPASAELYENGLSKGRFAQSQMPLKVAG
jgi:cytoskeletal protein RodZ